MDRSVFPAVFESTGWAPTYYVGGGADIRVLRRMLVGADFRYRRATADLNNTWVDFDPLDLSGGASDGGDVMAVLKAPARSTVYESTVLKRRTTHEERSPALLVVAHSAAMLIASPACAQEQPDRTVDAVAGLLDGQR